MQAADELGMLLQVECPNNTTNREWSEIVRFCRRHTSVIIYCCGNELLIDDPFIEYLKECAADVHTNTDALFAPMSAMRGIEYFWCEPEQEKELKEKPFKHHPRKPSVSFAMFTARIQAARTAMFRSAVSRKKLTNMQRHIKNRA